MHETLAGILVETKDYVEALTHYNKAISLNPMLDGPRAGIERLEKLLRGIDPDASDMSARSDDSVVRLVCRDKHLAVAGSCRAERSNKGRVGATARETLCSSHHFTRLP